MGPFRNDITQFQGFSDNHPTLCHSRSSFDDPQTPLRPVDVISVVIINWVLGKVLDYFGRKWSYKGVGGLEIFIFMVHISVGTMIFSSFCLKILLFDKIWHDPTPLYVKKSKFPMLPILLLFQGVFETFYWKRNKIPNVTNITVIPWCMWKHQLEKNQNSQCYQYYCYSMVYVKKSIDKNKIPNVTNITIVPWCLYKRIDLKNQNSLGAPSQKKTG